MSRWLAEEKSHQAEFRANSGCFSEGARQEGHYKSKRRSFCLPRSHAEENLYAGIRPAALAYFEKHQIKWHDGQTFRPSNHLCDSQVCCLNFLFPFADKPAALAALLKPVHPNLAYMLPIEDGQYVAHEWIGRQNYLGEKVPRHGIRLRGANATSVDAAVMFQQHDGRRHIVLIEWKYTESYSGTSLRYARPSGTDRLAIYAPLLDRSDCPIQREALPTWEALFYEPFYQLMRQQLLAHEMELAHELESDTVSVLHVAPAHNRSFQKVTSPALRELGNSATQVWKHLLRTPERFVSVNTEDFFKGLDRAAAP
ncbi:MAG TPA: hypothetical protein VLG46_10860, partial [Anaerolineae bacterium]|nr:hypothetical protein [Anaerolineae bacterium]